MVTEVGFEIKNAFGVVIARHDMLVPGLRLKGSSSCNRRARDSTNATETGAAPVRSNVNNAWYSDLGFAVSPELFVAFRPTNDKPVGLGFSPDGGPCFVGESADGVAPTFDYWVFGRKTAPRPPGTYAGIEVKDAAGGIVFSDDENPMIIRGVANESVGGSVYADAPGYYAIMPGQPVARPITYNYDSLTGRFYTVDQAFMFTLDGNGFAGQVRNSQIQRSSDTTQFAAPYANRVTSILIDVSRV